MFSYVVAGYTNSGSQIKALEFNDASEDLIKLYHDTELFVVQGGHERIMLNREQAIKLGKVLIAWGETGKLPENPNA